MSSAKEDDNPGGVSVADIGPDKAPRPPTSPCRRRVIEVEGLEDNIVIQEADENVVKVEALDFDMAAENLGAFIDSAAALDAETILHVVGNKIMDQYTIWDLVMHKAKLNADSPPGAMATILREAETLLCELKLLVEGCLEPARATNNDGCPSKKKKKASSPVTRDRVEIDAMLATAMGLDSDTWRSREEEDVDYFNNMLDVNLLFPEETRRRYKLVEASSIESDFSDDHLNETADVETELKTKEGDTENKTEDDGVGRTTRIRKRRGAMEEGEKEAPLAKRSVRRSRRRSGRTGERKGEGNEVQSKDGEATEAEVGKGDAVGPGKRSRPDPQFECVACRRRYVSEAALDHHYEKTCTERDPMEMKFEEIKGSGFRCEFVECALAEEIFPTRQEFSVHWADAHVPEEKKQLACCSCPRRFATNAARRAHAARDHERNFRCDTCRRKFYTEKALLVHSQTHRKVVAEDGTEMSPDTYLCLKCGTALCKAYGKMHEEKCTGVNVRAPEYKVAGGEYLCTVSNCDLGYGFNSMYGLRKHFHETHIGEDEKYFPCDYCGMKFSFNTTRNKHIKAIHEKSYVCKVCGKAFGGKDKLDGHMFVHSGEKPFSCDKCDYKTSKRYNLEMHKQSKHSEFVQKNYVCPVCKKQFVTKGRVRRHMQLLHPDGEAADGKSSPSKKHRPPALPQSIIQEMSDGNHQMVLLSSSEDATIAAAAAAGEGSEVRMVEAGAEGTVITVTDL